MQGSLFHSASHTLPWLAWLALSLFCGLLQATTAPASSLQAMTSAAAAICSPTVPTAFPAILQGMGSGAHVDPNVCLQARE